MPDVGKVIAGGERKASIAEAVSLRTPRNPRDQAVRKAQLDAFVRLVPATLLTQLLIAGVLAFFLRDSVDPLALGLWVGAAWLLSFNRFIRAMRLRHDRDYALARPPSIVAICVAVGTLGALWLVPAVFWFDQAGPDQRLFLCVLTAALLSAGTLTMVAVPPAAVV